METEVQGQILSVQGRSTKNGKTIYDIAFSDGNTYTTFDAALAAKVQSLQQQVVSARVKVEQKGQWTNFYFNDVAPSGTLAPLATPAPAGSPVPIPIATAPQAGSGGFQGGMSPERETKIVKQSLLSTSFNFIGALYTGAGPEALAEATAQALTLAKTLFGEVMSTGSVSPLASLVTHGVAQTPEGVAAEINAELGKAQPQAEETVIPWL